MSTESARFPTFGAETETGQLLVELPFTTSGQKTAWVCSYNTGARHAV